VPFHTPLLIACLPPAARCNRSNSSDSRVKQHGMVPLENLVGRATEIFMTDDWQRAGRWIGSPKK